MSTAIPNLRHLQIASEIARRGSISAAARTAHLSQPAVTQAVKSLERLFAVRLFERTSVGMTVTPSGKACLIRIDRALAQIDEAIAEARRSRVGSRGNAAYKTNSAQLQALVAVVERRGFSAAVAFYPACGLRGHFDDAGYRPYAPVRVLHGTADEETSPRRCNALVQRSRKLGGDIEITLYPGATHGFDDPGRARQANPDNRAAAADATARTLQFFAERLKHAPEGR